MPFIPLFFISFLCILLVISVSVLIQSRLKLALLKQEIIQYKLQNNKLSEELQQEKQHNETHEKRIDHAIALEAAHVTELTLLKQEIEKYNNSLQEKDQQLLSLQQTLHQAQMARKVTEEQLSAMHTRLQDWEAQQQTAIQHAKAAIFEAGQQLSVKLMEDHKRLADASNTQVQEQFQQNSTQLHTQFQKIVESVAALESQVKHSSSTVELVKQALLSPMGAGMLAEITLENILKASGLAAGRDYELQYHITGEETGSRLRPDAVVFLPNDHVLIIDCKASVFFMDEAEVIEEATASSPSKIKESMQRHLKGLASKEYQENLRKSLKRPSSNAQHISLVMFIPTDAALEKLQIIDPLFMQKAWEQKIYPAGPASLIHMLAHAKFFITEEKQRENHQHIVEEMRKLLVALATLSDHAKKLGSALSSATTHYDKFAASFNAGLLSRAKTMQKLGIELPATKQLPDALDRYHLVTSQELPLVEVEG